MGEDMFNLSDGKKLYEKLRKKQLKWYINKAIEDEVCKYA